MKNLQIKNCCKFMRPARETVHNYKLVIPILTIKGDTNCAICLNEIDLIGKYITKCNHVFHLDCIWNYLEHTGKLKQLSEQCKKYCKHSENIMSFQCPICKTNINK